MKNSFLSGLFVLLGFVVIAASAYTIISYATDILNAIVNFVITSDFDKLQSCGATIPPQFVQMKDDLPTVILPFLYLGIPAVLLLLSFLMFVGGYYYSKARHESETRKTQDMRRQITQKFYTKGKLSLKQGLDEKEDENEEEEEESEEEEKKPQMRKGR